MLALPIDNPSIPDPLTQGHGTAGSAGGVDGIGELLASAGPVTGLAVVAAGALGTPALGAAVATAVKATESTVGKQSGGVSYGTGIDQDATPEDALAGLPPAAQARIRKSKAFAAAQKAATTEPAAAADAAPVKRKHGWLFRFFADAAARGRLSLSHARLERARAAPRPK